MQLRPSCVRTLNKRRHGGRAMENFSDLTQRELLALAILPFLVPSFTVAVTIAAAVVVAELAAISWVCNRYMDTLLLSAGFQVFVGGLLVFATGIAIGSG
jgi:hypothetical protein